MVSPLARHQPRKRLRDAESIDLLRDTSMDDSLSLSLPERDRATKRLREAFALMPASSNANASQPMLPDMSQDTLALFPRIVNAHMNGPGQKPSGIAKAALISTLNRATALHNPFVQQAENMAAPRTNSEETPVMGRMRRLSNVPPASATQGTMTTNESDPGAGSTGADLIGESSDRATLKMLMVVASQPRKFSLDFQEVGIAGEGDFSQVVIARSRIDGVEYAVKRNKKVFTCDKMKLDALKEVFALAALQDHPAIVRYHNAWFERGGQSLYIQTALMRGGNVYDNYVHDGRKMPAKRIRSLISCIAGALKFMHGRHVLHNDIKPDNIFEDPADGPEGEDRNSMSSGRYVLGDFGLASRADAPGSAVEGDSRYLCPEALNNAWQDADDDDEEMAMQDSSSGMEGNTDGGVAKRERLSLTKRPVGAADVFSLGVTVYELATAVAVPKSGHLWMLLRTDCDQAARDVAVACDDSKLGEIVGSCLRSDPLERATAAQVVEMLSGIEKAEASALREENGRLKAELEGLRAMYTQTRQCLTDLVGSARKVEKKEPAVRRSSRRALADANR